MTGKWMIEKYGDEEYKIINRSHPKLFICVKKEELKKQGLLKKETDISSLNSNEIKRIYRRLTASLLSLGTSADRGGGKHTRHQF